MALLLYLPLSLLPVPFPREPWLMLRLSQGVLRVRDAVAVQGLAARLLGPEKGQELGRLERPQLELLKPVLVLEPVP